MDTSRNPYSPPRARVADIPHTGAIEATSATGAKKSLLPLWLASLYCIVTGLGHAAGLALALYRARDLLDWPMPLWVYFLGFIQPTARIAGGVSLIRRTRFTPPLLAAVVTITALFPILWQFLQTGAVTLNFGPVLWLQLADLMLLLLITRYAFALHGRGALR